MSAAKVKATEAEIQQAIAAAEDVVYMGMCYTVYSPVDYNDLCSTKTSRQGNSEGQAQYFLAVERAIVALSVLGVETDEDELEKRGLCLVNFSIAYDDDDDDDDYEIESAAAEREWLSDVVYRTVVKFVDVVE